LLRSALWASKKEAFDEIYERAEAARPAPAQELAPEVPEPKKVEN
jgi:hypothetical protein